MTDLPEDLNTAATEALIMEVLRMVQDPELPINIVDMGLIYGIDMGSCGEVTIRMTLTTPMCPAAELLPKQVEQKAAGVDGVERVTVELVWEPPWTPEMMSDAARLESGLM